MARPFFKGPHMIYLAGPMANVSKEEAQGWRADMHQELHEVGMIAFDPSRAWGWPPRDLVTPAMTSIIQTIDDVAVAMSSAMVVRYQGVESVGTDHEVQLAQALDKPLIIWTDHDLDDVGWERYNKWVQRLFPGVIPDNLWRSTTAWACAQALKSLLP